MRLIKTAIALVTIAASASVAPTAAQAQTQTFTGSTTSCFGSSCTLSSSTADNFANIFFNGVNNFNWTAISGASQTVTLGTFDFSRTSCAGVFLCPGSSQFTLNAAFTTPPTVPGGSNYNASLHGAFVLGSGGMSVNFNNTPAMFTFNGGYATLSVNDLTVPPGLRNYGNYDLTGTLTYTSTPEPSSMALLGTGLVGLVPMIRRRRK